MKLLPRLTLAALVLLITLAATAVAQQKRQAPARPQPKPAAAPTPAPTFDTLVPAETYFLYLEARNAGQLIQSSSFNDALEPILKLAGPPKEFSTIVKWLNEHADEVMSSRVLVAGWPINQDLPEAIIAVEFASPDEATKFKVSLNAVLKGVIPATPVPASEPNSENVKTIAATTPGYYLRQAGSLIMLTPTPLELKKLKPAKSKLLSDDANFRAARTRFNSESLFAFFDMKSMERQEEERQKQFEQLEKERLLAVELEAKSAGDPPPPAVIENEVPPSAVDNFTITELEKKDSPGMDPAAMALMLLSGAFFNQESKWPDAIAVALSLENDSFDLRALLLNEAGEKSDPVPFLPMLAPGPPVAFEASNIVPADTQLLAMMSLDLPQMYTAMSGPRPARTVFSSQPGEPQTSPESPFAEIEKKLKINLRDDLLPLLGNEIAFRLPAASLPLVGLMGGVGIPTSNAQPSGDASPVILVSLRDKEAMRALMPKLIDALGFKGASSLAQTERREDTEIVSYLNVVSYAFIGNFLVLSGDPASVRRVVDSYLKNETLGSDGNFRNFTRWQPRPAQGQVYVSPALMQGYLSWAEQSKHINEQAKLFLTPLVAQPITYSLSNEGFGPLHELHLPKSLVLMAVAGISGAVDSPRQPDEEMTAQAVMMQIAYFQENYKNESGSYGTLEQLTAAKLIHAEMIEGSGYKFEILVSGDKFEAFATPIEYGANRKTSYFIDQTRRLRGADHNGAPANGSDPPIY